MIEAPPGSPVPCKNSKTRFVSGELFEKNLELMALTHFLKYRQCMILGRRDPDCNGYRALMLIFHAEGLGPRDAKAGCGLLARSKFQR